MNRRRALLVSLAVAVAAVAGVLALGSTVSQGGRARASSAAQVARRTAQLDRYEAALRKSLAQQPPPLPPLPQAGAQAAATRSTAAVRVVYRRPPPILVKRRDDDEGGRESAYEEAGSDD